MRKLFIFLVLLSCSTVVKKETQPTPKKTKKRDCSAPYTKTLKDECQMIQNVREHLNLKGRSI